MAAIFAAFWRFLLHIASAGQSDGASPSRSGTRLAFESLEDRFALDAESAGPDGIRSLGLKLADNTTALDGSGAAIGQVEFGRPGLPGFDSDSHSHPDVTPAAVFSQGDEPEMDQDGISIQDGHAEIVAGVMIASGAAEGGSHKGVAYAAALYASASESYEGGDKPAKYLLAMQEVALHNGGAASAINLSWATEGPRDGTSALAKGLDWSARVHDVLYVKSRGNITNFQDIVPSDAYNTLNVTASHRRTVGERTYFGQVTDDSAFTNAIGRRRLTHLVAPGANVLTTTLPEDGYVAHGGTSIAAPHATGTVALLQQFGKDRINAEADRFDANKNALRHEVMKAVLMNSADKLEDTGDRKRLDMDKTILTKFPEELDWLGSDAQDKPRIAHSIPMGWKLPLDDQLGTGQLNAERAREQYLHGEFDPTGDEGTVQLIGWDYEEIAASSTDPQNRYRLEAPLIGEGYISITLTWDRIVNVSGGDDVYHANETFSVPSPPADLNVFLVPRGEDNFIAASLSGYEESPQQNVEHLFFQVPRDGARVYDIVVENENGPATKYALAWWGIAGGAQASLPGGVGDRVWHDVDANGIQDVDEPGIADIPVNLFNSDHVWIDATWTDAVGNYQFSDVAAGDYYVRFGKPADYTFTLKDAGDDALDSDVDGTGKTEVFTVGVAVITHKDAGLVTRLSSSLGDRVWQDNDQDGVQDAGEPGVEGVTVFLYTSQGELLDFRNTSSTGAYSFTDVEPGDYYVKFELPWGYKAFSPKDAGGNDALDSDANSSGQTVTFSLASGANNTSIDCGLIDNASPVAANDTAYVVHDRTLNVSAPGLLSNDTDTEFDSLHAELVNDPTYGAVDLNVDGSYVYTPPSAWTGVDTFTYRVWDGYQWSNTATVTVNVTNMQPSTSANSYVTPSSGPLVVAAPGVLGNDGDSDGDTLTASLVTNVSQGTLSFNSNGGFTYTKPSGFSGVVFFSYKAFDGVAYSNTTTVGITVSPSFLTLDGDAADAGRGSPDPAPVTKEQVRDLMHEAIARWHDAGADRQELRERWQDLNLHVFDLPDNRLAAQAGDDIVIDINAAGHGWFVDGTATHDGEFPIFVADTERRSEEPDADATGSVDLLAALMHEAGHWLGLPHYDAEQHPHNVMLDTLPPSTRRVPADGQGDVQPFEVKHFARSRPLTPALSPEDGGEGTEEEREAEVPHYKLRPLIRIAAAYWDEQGVPREELRQLRQVEILVTDLPGDHVGLTSVDTIWIDSALRRREAAATIAHERGHVLGLGHDDPSGIMSASLPDAKRALFAAFADWDDWRL